MLSPRENMLAILKGEQPDYYNDFMNAGQVILDPIWMADGTPKDGELHKDTWGVTKCFPPTAPGAHPIITAENRVLADIEDWEDVVKAPTIDLDWTSAIEQASKVDRGEKFVVYFSATGIFERTHFLMGMEDAFCAYLEEPEAMTGLVNYIADYKVRCMYAAGEKIKPDVVFYQDDWASKQNLFLPPAVWREIIKPATQKVIDAIHEIGAICLMHSDCKDEIIAPDMVDLGIDVWQGVIPENDIVAIQEATNHMLPMIGGVDTPYCDRPDATEEEIRAHVRKVIDTYCPGGKFYPGHPGGGCFRKKNNEISLDELDKYGRQWALEHPIK